LGPGTGIRDLQTLIDPSSPFSLTGAKDVNDNGWIIATANDSVDGYQHAVILKPIFLPGDFNRDGHVNAQDIAVMLQALSNSSLYESSYGVTSAELLEIGDINHDGKLTNADIQSLLNFLKNGGGSTTAVPEPPTVFLFILGTIGLVIIIGCKHAQEPYKRRVGCDAYRQSLQYRVRNTTTAAL
jgi:hypothetical protein